MLRDMRRLQTSNFTDILQGKHVGCKVKLLTQILASQISNLQHMEGFRETSQQTHLMF